MQAGRTRREHIGRRLRNWACAISTLTTVAWLLTLVFILVGDVMLGYLSAPWELAFLAGIGAASAVIIRLAWGHEQVCGPLLLAWGLEFAFVAHWTIPPASRLAAIVAAGAPYLVAGLLALASRWWLPGAGDSRKASVPIRFGRGK
jgi:hypothetical protein